MLPCESSKWAKGNRNREDAEVSIACLAMARDVSGECGMAAKNVVERRGTCFKKVVKESFLEEVTRYLDLKATGKGESMWEIPE